MYKKIMVPLDGSELAECVFPHLESIAGGCGVEEVVFVNVVQPVHLPVGALGDGGPAYTKEDAEKARKRVDERAMADAKKYLDQVAGRVKLGGIKAQTGVVLGNAHEGLADYANNNDIDLIIMATHGRSGISRWFMGSVADRVIRSASVPVLMVRAPGTAPEA